MAGEMAQMALEIGLEQDYWERPRSLMNYVSFMGIDFDSFIAEEEEEIIQCGAEPCEWSDI